MRSASELLDWPTAGSTAASKQTQARASFSLSLLHDIGAQLVVVRPQTLGGVIQELVRIVPCAREALENATPQHVPGAVAFPNLIEQSLPNLFHHVPLRTEFRLRQDGPVRRYDPRLLIREPQEDIHRIHAAADPRSGQVVERGIAQRRSHVAHRK